MTFAIGDGGASARRASAPSRAASPARPRRRRGRRRPTTPGAAAGAARPQAAGLRAGDVVVSVDGEPIDAATASSLAAGPRQPRRAGRRRRRARRRPAQTLPVTPGRGRAPSARPSDGDVIETVGAIGVLPQSAQDTERLGPVEALQDSGATPCRCSRASSAPSPRSSDDHPGLQRDRDPEGFIGIVGAGRISGEVLASEETPRSRRSVRHARRRPQPVRRPVQPAAAAAARRRPHRGRSPSSRPATSSRDCAATRGELLRVDLTKLLPLTYARGGVLRRVHRLAARRRHRQPHQDLPVTSST